MEWWVASYLHATIFWVCEPHLGFSMRVIAVFWALRGLAPTNLTLSGACGGLLAGSMATIAYSLGCPEMQIPFWGVWYLLGMLVPTVLGALLGRSWLRW